jgi:hypothetical protein
MAIETSATQQSRRPRHNPENNNPIDNGRENLHSINKGLFTHFCQLNVSRGQDSVSGVVQYTRNTGLV